MIALVSGILLMGSTASPGEDLPARIEVVEEATESFANAMLDLGLALRDGRVTDFRAAIAPHLEAIPLPGEPQSTIPVHGWVRRHGWQLEARPADMTRGEFIDDLEEFLDHFSNFEDVRLKVKKSNVTGKSIQSEVALAIVARDKSGRRAWTRGWAKVHATRSNNDPGWTIDRFIVTTLDTMIATREVFSEVALPAGVARTDPPFLARRGPPFAAYGAAVGDIDRDGFFDIVVTSEDGNSLYLNRGDGTFDDAATDARIRDVHGDVIAPLLLDVDNDGDLDLFLSAVGYQMLFENRLLPDGRLEFWDVSLESGVAVHAIGFSAVAGDVDGNGYPDIYVTSYNRYGQILPDRWDRATNGTPNLLLLNRGDGRFEEVATALGVHDSGWSYAAAFADVDRDGDLDLYVANDFGGGNSLFINQGDVFVNQAEDFGVADGGYGMGVSFGDYDNDGDLDLHVTRMSSTAGRRILARLASEELPSRKRLEELAIGNALYQNTGGGFRDISSKAGPFPAGWAWGGGFIDLDNDGGEDIFTPNGFISGSKLHDT
jgi:hypothetical protein